MEHGSEFIFLKTEFVLFKTAQPLQNLDPKRQEGRHTKRKQEGTAQRNKMPNKSKLKVIQIILSQRQINNLVGK